MRQLTMSHIIRIYTVCHFVFDFKLKPIYTSGHVQIQGQKSPQKKLRGERANIFLESKLLQNFYN